MSYSVMLCDQLVTLAVSSRPTAESGECTRPTSDVVRTCSSAPPSRRSVPRLPPTDSAPATAPPTLATNFAAWRSRLSRSSYPEPSRPSRPRPARPSLRRCRLRSPIRRRSSAINRLTAPCWLSVVTWSGIPSVRDHTPRFVR